MMEAMVEKLSDKMNNQMAELSDRILMKLDEASKKHDLRIDVFEHEIFCTQTRMDDLEKKLAETNDALAEMTSKFKHLQRQDAHIEEVKRKMGTMQRHSDGLEQYSRRNNIRITGIPPNEQPAPKDALSGTEVAANAINKYLQPTPPVTPSDIDRAHLVGRKEAEHRPLLIKLNSYSTKARLFERKSSLKNTGIFLSEDLTKGRAELYWKCRQEKKLERMQNCWTHDGNILIKTNDGQIKRVESVNDL